MNIIDILRDDGVGVIATDTVYGIVARLLSPTAVERIYDVKHSDSSRPVGTILIASVEQLHGVVDDEYLEKAAKYWPGPTSVILPVGDELGYAHKGLGSLPFRVPDDDRLVGLLNQTGPLATSSANLPSQPPATNINQAKEYFGDGVDFYQDGGSLQGRGASQIIKLLPNGRFEQIRS
jgi:L-threonylcarbamoyladenylate synthase